MGHRLTIEFSDEEYDVLTRIAGWAQWTPEEFTRFWINQKLDEIDNDKLLKLAGCLDNGPSDLGERHDEYLSQSLLEEMRAGG